MAKKIDIDDVSPRKEDSGFDFMYVFWALFIFFLIIGH